jgi:hypothetical protein
MTMQATTEATHSGPWRNTHTPVFHEVPKLMETVRNAFEEHHVGRLALWLLGLAILGLIAAASVFFLAVSPYLIAALAPLFQS